MGIRDGHADAGISVHADYVHIREDEGICENEDAAYLIHIIRMKREKKSF